MEDCAVVLLVLALAVAGAIVLLPPIALVRLVSRLQFMGLHKTLFLVRTDEKAVALTLDDGPHPAVTPLVLGALARHKAHATFFLIGSRAARYPELVNQILAEGHEVGNHTWEDERSASLTPERFEESLSNTHDVLAEFQQPMRLFRPGGGWPTSCIVALAGRLGYRCVLGSVYPNDTRIPFRRFIVWAVLQRVCPGAIVILHEGTKERKRVADVLDSLLPRLRKKGYRVTTVSDLLDGATTHT